MSALPPDTLEQMLQRDTSPWTFGQKVRRVLWMLVQGSLFAWSFHNWYGWRRLLLRLFGAQVGRGVRIRPTVRIEIPWHLRIEDFALVGDFAVLYALGEMRIGRYSTISQYAHLCGGTHNYRTRSFPLIRAPITIGDDVWVAAQAFVGPGVTIGDRSILGACAVAMKDIPADQIWAGNPAEFVRPRKLQEHERSVSAPGPGARPDATPDSVHASS